MIDALYSILKECIMLFDEMAPYLLFGFLVAGFLHLFVSTRTIARHLGKGDAWSVIKAALFGVPLPLCSCGVIPAAMSLRREGASRGSTISFLISTPTTGVDSIFATYALLGPFFAAYRVIASFTAGVVSGIAANLLLGHEAPAPAAAVVADDCATCTVVGGPPGEEGHRHSVLERLRVAVRYAFVELLGETAQWIVIGIVLGGVIAWLIPDSFFQSYLGRGWQAMILMLVVGIPLYVCATGSIPIAAVLMMKGMSPGAAFVFLLAGPATNTVTVTVVGNQLGKKALAIYLASISLCAVLFGMGLDLLWESTGIGAMNHQHAQQLLPPWVHSGSSVLLLVLIVGAFARRFAAERHIHETDLPPCATIITVEGMTCQHCIDNVTTMFRERFDLYDVRINLADGKVCIVDEVELDRAAVAAELAKLGYTVKGS